YLVSATLEGVLAQRLVRRVCAECRESYEPPEEHVSSVAGRPVERTVFIRGAGCPMCRGTGFRGRVGIFELLVITDDVRDAIATRASRAELRVLAQRAGMVPLRADGWQRVESDLTTVEEVIRVVQE